MAKLDSIGSARSFPKTSRDAARRDFAPSTGKRVFDVYSTSFSAHSLTFSFRKPTELIDNALGGVNTERVRQ